MALPNTNTSISPSQRIRIWYAFLVLIVIIFSVRLFYVQIIRYDFYKNAALSDQLKQYEIPATRGIIEVHNGDSLLPIVLNQELYTLYADPVYIKNVDQAAAKLVPIIGGDAISLVSKMNTKNTRYVVLAKKINAVQQKQISALKFPGLGTISIDYRTYPQGILASQLLGFVNDDGKGVYGLEQALNNELKGTSGQLKAITDVNGIPLAASKDNINVAPKTGDNVILTIDVAMQQQMESILAAGVDHAKASGASALIIDPNTGAIKAMANYPSYDPSQYVSVSDPSIFQNAAVSQPIEVGSIMKTLTASAAIDQGLITADSKYNDPGSWTIDGAKVVNVAEDGGPGVHSISELLNLSLNTGAIWMLMQMGGNQINEKARNIWHDYLVNHYQLGKPTGIEQGYESSGYIPSPAENGAGINLTYAETAFGQAMTATPLQMGAAISSVLNGGTYYQPHLVDQTINSDGKTTTVKPKIIKQNVVEPKVAQSLIGLMQYVVEHHNIVPAFDQSRYIVGGKTGTAQIAEPGGVYYPDKFNGTYMGFVGGDKVQYVIVVFVDRPTIGGYAGTVAAQPIFGNLAHMLINNSYVIPKNAGH